ncbi:MAG TPA: helix-turn-helix domain-containing protein [Pyrinomonadaceae bacterium]|nr:helix-turn-helix domain-containing protein [Pyrinomonadaceae bacterium]
MGISSRRPDPDQARGAVLEDALRGLPPLTDKQAECLRYVLDYFLERRYYPTQREVAAAMSLNSSTAESYLKPLIQKGYLEREPRRRRNVRLTAAAVRKFELMGVSVREQLLAVA